MTFDRRKFNRLAHQLRYHADGYKSLGLDGETAAAWANGGFTPDEAKPWIAEEFPPDEATRWADNFVSPTAARTEINRRAARAAR